MRRILMTMLTVTALLALNVLPALAQPGGEGGPGEALLGPGFVRDAGKSAEGEAAAELVLGLMFGRMPGYEARSAVYRFDGTVQGAFDALRVPQRADVAPPSPATAGERLGAMLMLMEDRAPYLFGEIDRTWARKAKTRVQASYGDPALWVETATARVQEWGAVKGQTFRVTLGMDALVEQQPLPGTTVDLVILEGGAPWVDLVGLTTAAGTFVQVSEVTFTVPEAEEGEWDDDQEYDDERMDHDAVDLGVERYPGLIPVDPEEFADELQGDDNFLVETPIDDVRRFYLEQDGRNCYVEGDSTIYVDDVERPFVEIICTDHDGPAEEGDDVVAIVLTVPSSAMLSSTAGRNQGSWTYVAFSRFPY